jgi:hypothetical protein
VVPAARRTWATGGRPVSQGFGESVVDSRRGCRQILPGFQSKMFWREDCPAGAGELKTSLASVACQGGSAGYILPA